MHHYELASHLLGEKDHISVIEDRGSKTAEPPESLEVLCDRESGIAEVVRPGLRREFAAFRLQDHIVRECPVPSRRHRPVGICHIELIPHLDDSRVFHAAAVISVHARTEYRLCTCPVEMHPVSARGEAEPDDMFLVISGCTVQHVEHAVVINDSRVACNEILPVDIRIRRKNRIVLTFLEFHRIN